MTNEFIKRIIPTAAQEDPVGYLNGLKNNFHRGLETGVGTGTYNPTLGDYHYGLWPHEDSAKVWSASDTNKSTPIPEKIAYAGGRVAGTIMSDKARSWFWRYNHPLGITSSIGQEIPQNAGLAPNKKGSNRLAAVTGGFLLSQALDLGSGNTDIFNMGEGGRPKGYSALLPQYDDPTKSQNIGIEIPLGYITGRKGKLLPWEQFTLERPDVSMEKYNEYKQYQSPNTPGLFGIEQLNPVGTAALGAGIGALKGYRAAKNVHPAIENPRSPGKGAVLGAVIGGLAGAAVPGAADLLSRMGMLKGTWSNLDGIPEAQLLGYKVDAKGALIATGAGAALHGRAKYLANRKQTQREAEELAYVQRQREHLPNVQEKFQQLDQLNKKINALDPNTRHAVVRHIEEQQLKDQLATASPEFQDRILNDLVQRENNRSARDKLFKNPDTGQPIDDNAVNDILNDYKKRHPEKYDPTWNG